MLESCARAGLGGGISVLPTLPIAAGVAAGVLVAKPLIGWATPRVVAAAAFLRACLFGNSARAAECHDPPTISLILTLAPVTAVPGREAATHTPFITAA